MRPSGLPNPLPEDMMHIINNGFANNSIEEKRIREAIINGRKCMKKKT